MPGPSPRRSASFTVPCRCGTYHIVAVSSFGRQQTCPKCRSGYMVVWKKDPRKGTQTPIVVSSRPRAVRPPNKPAPAPSTLIQLACNCGYRRQAGPAEFRKGTKCPGCGNPMYVDRPARTKPTSTIPLVPFSDKTRYAPGLKASTPPGIQAPAMTPPSFRSPSLTPPSFPSPATPPVPTRRPAITGAIPIPSIDGKTMLVCTVCGDRLLVTSSDPNRRMRCLRCDGPMKMQMPSVAPVEKAVFEAPPPSPPPEPEPPAPPRPPARPKAAPGGPTIDCPCGEPIPIPDAAPGSVYVCDACGRKATMQKGAKHPQTLKLMLKAQFEEPSLDVSLEPGAIEILCECGEGIIVSLRDVGHPVQCPGCSMLLEVQNTSGGLKVKPMGKVDEQNWSLGDFS